MATPNPRPTPRPTPNPPPAPTPAPPNLILGQPVSVLTQRYGSQRTGGNTAERVLTVDAVSSSEFQKLYTIPVSGQVYAQPLLVPQVWFPDGTFKNVLIVATMQDMVFAFQVDDVNGPAFSPQLLWSTTIGSPVPSNFMPMGYSTWSCNVVGAGACAGNADPPSNAKALPPVGSPPGHTTWVGYDSINDEGTYNINPLIGILSTPVVDRANNKIFVVGKVLGLGPSPTSTQTNDLVALDLFTGTILTRTPISGGFTSQGGTCVFDQQHHMQRPGLLLQNGEIYIGFGSHQDTPPWHGWIFRYNAATLQQSGVWCSTPNSLGGAIWQAGSGITSDSAGNIYVMTGNGCNLDSGGHCADSEYPAELHPPADNSFNTGMSNFANMFVQLDATLGSPVSVLPGDEQHRETEDLDVGSAGPVFIPGTNSLIGGEKEGRLFVLSTNPTFQLTQTFQAAQQADSFSVHGSGYHHIHGSPAVWRGPQGMTAYVWPERDFLRAFHWNDNLAKFDCKADPNGCEQGNTTTPDQISTFPAPSCTGCMPGGIVSLSADGSKAHTGIVWASLPLATNDPPLIGGGLNNVVPGVLHALDAENIAHDLWNSQANATRDGSFMFAKFNPPMVANGRVYMATFGSIPSGGMQASTGSVNVYGLKQWAKFLSQTGVVTHLDPGQSFTSNIEFFNAGTTVWQKGAYRLGAQDPQDNSLWGVNRIELPHDVHPGEEVILFLNLTAPTAPGTYHHQWRMVQENVEWFGEFSPAVSIQVGHKLVVPPVPDPTFAHGKNTVIVTVNDETGAAVGSASVSITVKRPNQADVTVTKPTNSSGQATLTYSPCKQRQEGELVEVECKGVASKGNYTNAIFYTPTIQ